jgi:hypothetical protein
MYARTYSYATSGETQSSEECRSTSHENQGNDDGGNLPWMCLYPLENRFGDDSNIHVLERGDGGNRRVLSIRAGSVDCSRKSHRGSVGSVGGQSDDTNDAGPADLMGAFTRRKGVLESGLFRVGSIFVALSIFVDLAFRCRVALLFAAALFVTAVVCVACGVACVPVLDGLQGCFPIL